MTKLKTLSTVILFAFSINASAQLSAPKTEVNSINGDRVLVDSSFASPVSGDLYIAVDVGGGNLFFFANGGTQFSPQAIPFKANADLNQTISVINLDTAGIPAGNYPVYEVVAKAGSDVFQTSNWITALSSLTMSINLKNTAPVTPTGKSLYSSLGCGDSSCHGPDPANNGRGVLLGKTLNIIKSQITNVDQMRNRLSNASDSDLQAVADYLATFN